MRAAAPYVGSSAQRAHSQEPGLEFLGRRIARQVKSICGLVELRIRSMRCSRSEGHLARCTAIQPQCSRY